MAVSLSLGVVLASAALGGEADSAAVFRASGISGGLCMHVAGEDDAALAAPAGRLYVSTEDGRLHCFAK